MRVGHVLFDVLQTIEMRLAPATIIVWAKQNGGDVELAFLNIRDLEC